MAGFGSGTSYEGKLTLVTKCEETAMMTFCQTVLYIVSERYLLRLAS